jgi:tetratricopeptide (TPR) repeat protein
MKKIYYTLGLLLIMTTSCSSGFLKEYSQDLSQVQTYQDLDELLLGDCYLPKGLFANENSYYQLYNPNFIVLHFMGDELSENTEVQSDQDGSGYRQKFFGFYTWQQNVNINYLGVETYDDIEDDNWVLAYKCIGTANMVIDAANDMKTANDEDAAELTRVKGEAYFLRACYYYMLVNLYAKPYSPSTAASTPGVPIKTTAYVEDKDYTRNTVDEVYKQINSDLDQAEVDLKNVTTPKSTYRAGINAVYLFRSRIYLYMQQWDKAKDYAQKSLNMNGSLQSLIGFSTSSYPLNSSSPETIWSMGSSLLGNVLLNRPNSTRYAPVWYISDHLYNLYDANDSRLTTFFSKTDDHVSGKPCYHKIDNSSASYGKYKTVSDVYLLRSAEAYLNLAEAAAQLGDATTSCNALKTLRESRMSAGAAVSLTGADLVTFVREERERELCLEGHRWFDLRRYMVDKTYPYTKEIEHSFTRYSDTYPYHETRTDWYRLEKNDDAYTLNIPKNVRDFQNTIGSNSRPERSIVRTDSYE